MYDNVIWVSSYWMLAYVIIWISLCCGIGLWLDDKFNGAAGYGPADALVASIGPMVLGLIAGTIVFFALAYLQQQVITIGFRS